MNAALATACRAERQSAGRCGWNWWWVQRRAVRGRWVCWAGVYITIRKGCVTADSDKEERLFGDLLGYLMGDLFLLGLIFCSVFLIYVM